MCTPNLLLIKENTHTQTMQKKKKSSQAFFVILPVDMMQSCIHFNMNKNTVKTVTVHTIQRMTCFPTSLAVTSDKACLFY